MEKIEQKDHISLIIELYYNMKIKFFRQEFVDFVGRIYRFKEAVLRYLIELNFGVSTEIDKKSGKQNSFFEWIECNADMKQFIKSEKAPNGTNLDNFSFGLPLLMACLKYLIEINYKRKYI